MDNTDSSVRALLNNRWAPVTLEALLQNNLNPPAPKARQHHHH